MKVSEKPLRGSVRSSIPKAILLGALFLTLLAFGVRFGLRNAGMFHYDEVITVRALEHWHTTGEFIGETSGRYGFVLINGLFYFPYHWLTGSLSAEPIPRFTSAIFGGLIAGMLTLLTYQLFRKDTIAFGAGFLAVVNPLLLSQGTIGKEHTVSTFFLLMALYGIAQYRENGKYQFLALTSTAAGIALSVRESTLVFIPLVLVYGAGVVMHKHHLMLRQSRGGSREYLFGFAALLIPLCLIFLPLCTSGLCSLIGDIPGGPTSGQTFLSSASHFASIRGEVMKAGIADLFRSIFPIGVLLALAGVILCWSKDERLFAMIGVTWMLTFLYFTNITGYAARFFTEIIPIMLILIAVAVDAAAHRQVVWMLLIAGIGVLFLAQQLPLLVYRHHTDGPMDFAELVRNSTESNAEIIVADDAPFIWYYAERQTMSHPIALITDPYPQWLEVVADQVRNGTPVYVITLQVENRTALPDYDEANLNGQVYTALNRKFNLTVVAEGKSENYHHAELLPSPRQQRLERLRMRESVLP